MAQKPGRRGGPSRRSVAVALGSGAASVSTWAQAPVAAASAATAASTAPGAMTLALALAPVEVLQAAISPDGEHVAAVVNRVGHRAVMLVRTADRSHRDIVVGHWGRDGHYMVSRHPLHVRWITRELLAVDHGWIAEAVDLQGERVADLGSAVIGKARPGVPDSTQVLVFDDHDRDSVSMIDVRTRRRTAFDLPMSGGLVNLAFDAEGRLRAVTMSSSSVWSDRTRLSLWYRGPAGGDWQRLAEYAVGDERLRPLSASVDRDELMVASRQGRETSAIFAYDPVKRQLGELLAGHPTEDIVGLDDPHGNQHPSVVTMGMKPVRHWFDGRWAGLQKAVDQALPGRLNVISGQPRGRVLVASYADVDPGTWYLLDTEGMRMRALFVARPHLSPERMRPMQALSYASDDGLRIPAYLTLPAGEAPHPLVVMVHGGPWVRDHWGWDPEVQLLAARGYAVLQPQFRGSTGLGRTLERAGDGQWGRGMQDDISAGVRHLVRQGVADGRRVAIYGASYGGYAAVWGLIRTPELYRCGITRSGVSDIGELFSDWNDGTKASRELQRRLIGDPQRDRERLDAVSPVRRAADIGAPLLIAHGDDDARVPIGHARRLMKAMDAAGKPYEWLLLDGEGHAIDSRRQMERFLSAMLAFLERHLGRPGPP
ncbi:MAG: S9 family peptidase [Rubrivivax sp.]